MIFRLEQGPEVGTALRSGPHGAGASSFSVGQSSCPRNTRKTRNRSQEETADGPLMSANEALMRMRARGSRERLEVGTALRSGPHGEVECSRASGMRTFAWERRQQPRSAMDSQPYRPTLPGSVRSAVLSTALSVRSSMDDKKSRGTFVPRLRDDRWVSVECFQIRTGLRCRRSSSCR